MNGFDGRGGGGDVNVHAEFLSLPSGHRYAVTWRRWMFCLPAGPG